MILDKKYFPGYEAIPTEKNVVIEHFLRFGDLEEIKELLTEYGYNSCKKVWEETLLCDSRMHKLNVFLAKFIFMLSGDEQKNNSEHGRLLRGERIAKIFNR